MIPIAYHVLFSMEYRKPYKLLYEHNVKKYKGQMPSWEIVQGVLDRSNMTMYRFEMVFDITKKTLQRYKNGDRGLPPVYWHLFYDYDNLDKFYRNFKKKKYSKASYKKNKEKAARQKKQVKVSSSNKMILDVFRNKLS